MFIGQKTQYFLRGQLSPNRSLDLKYFQSKSQQVLLWQLSNDAKIHMEMKITKKSKIKMMKNKVGELYSDFTIYY